MARRIITYHAFLYVSPKIASMSIVETIMVLCQMLHQLPSFPKGCLKMSRNCSLSVSCILFLLPSTITIFASHVSGRM